MPLGSFRTAGGLGRRLARGIQYVTASGGNISYVNVDGVWYKLHQFTSNGTFSVTSAGIADILLVGGGGGGANLNPSGNFGAGGGGGGVIEQLQLPVTAQNYSITVGAGGISQYQGPGADGGSTIALGYTAGGGKRGNGAQGGNSGSPQNFAGSSGRNYANSSFKSLGNGGGAGGAAVGGTVDAATSNVYTGGPGYLTSFTGSPERYAAGAKGLKGQGDTTQNGTGWSSSTFGHGAVATSFQSQESPTLSKPGVAYIRYPMLGRPASTISGDTPTYSTGKFGNGHIWNTTNGTKTITLTQPIASNQDWTVEFWAYFSSASDRSFPLRVGTSWYWMIDSNTSYITNNTGDFTIYSSGSPSITPGSWRHIAFVYNGSTGSIQVYNNGTANSSFTRSTALPSIQIGRMPSTYFNSTTRQHRIDEIRISNNRRYTANFTAPTAAFTNDANTVALFHCQSNTETDDNA